MPATTVTADALIPTDVARLLIEPLEAASIALAAGPRIFDTSRPLSIPRLVGSDEPEFVAEGGAIPEAELSFDDVALMPTARKGIKSISRITNEALRASVIALDAAVQARIVGDAARVLDRALLTGDGTADTILGIIPQAGITMADADLTDHDTFMDAEALWLAAEVDPSRGRWLVNPADWIALAKVTDTTGRYLVAPDPTLAGRKAIDGIPVVITSRVPVGTVALVDFSMVAVARDLAPSVTILRELYAATDEVGIRVVTRWDVGLLHDEAVLVATAPVAP